MVAILKMAVLPANFRKWKLSFLQSVPKYANSIDPKRHMTFHSRNIELSVKYFVIWVSMLGNDWLTTILFRRKEIDHHKKITFVFDRKFRHFPDLPVLRDLFCIEPRWLPTTFKNLNSHKMFFVVTKFVMGGLEPKRIRPSGLPMRPVKRLEFHLMRAIPFYSPWFCLSNRVWHEQIVSCTTVTYPNNFKCHGTIFAIFWHHKTM